MRPVELGEFLRSRRRRLMPQDAGFPAGDRRRSPGLRREEVSTLAGVAVSWLARLEQGRAHAVSPEVLAALANALKLDDTERAHLFALAGFRSERAEAEPSRVTAAMRALLDALEPNPAYVLDRAWNMVAWNGAEVWLFPGLLEYEGPPNLLEIVLTNADLRRLMVDHDEEVVRLVSQFRVHRTEWPDDPELTDLIERLQTSSETFAALWAAKDVAPFHTTRRVFEHPDAGRIEFDHHRLLALDQPGTQLVVYTRAR